VVLGLGHLKLLRVSKDSLMGRHMKTEKMFAIIILAWG